VDWIQLIEKMTPLMSVIAVATVSWYPVYKTAKNNRELTLFNKQKEDIESFSKACGKYFGIASILTSVLESTHHKSDSKAAPPDTKHADNMIQELVENKWEILSCIHNETMKEIQEKMEIIEDFAKELHDTRVLQDFYFKVPTPEEEREKITNKIRDEIKPKIYDISQELQNLLVKHKKLISNNLKLLKGADKWQL